MAQPVSTISSRLLIKRFEFLTVSEEDVIPLGSADDRPHHLTSLLVTTGHARVIPRRSTTGVERHLTYLALDPHAATPCVSKYLFTE